MASEPPKRHKRTPFSQEEVAEMIALRKKRAHIKLLRFRKSKGYIVMNVFNLACIFIYLEILFCFFGPSDKEHISYTEVHPNYRARSKGAHDLISSMDVIAVNGYTYNFLVKDDRTVPESPGEMIMGQDFLLQKDLKATFPPHETSFRLFAASPVLVLAALVIFIAFIAFYYNLNEEAYSLMALTVLNSLTMLGILLL
jgi:hypothetical protein